MTDTLFDLAPTTAAPDTPRCKMCTSPAYWSRRLKQWAPWCGPQRCTNRERLCQSCSNTFIIGVNGAGTKYCSTDCKSAGYSTGKARPPRCFTCAWCGNTNPAGQQRRYGGIWPYICEDCLHPIRHVVHQLKAHRVPHERARQLINNPGCEICGRNILTKVSHARGRPKVLLHVDHDHVCCPLGDHSCGECVRGLICQGCNLAAGGLRDDPKIARALADYLERQFSRTDPQ